MRARWSLVWSLLLAAFLGCKPEAGSNGGRDSGAEPADAAGTGHRDAAPGGTGEAGMQDAGEAGPGEAGGSEAPAWLGLNASQTEDAAFADLEVMALGARAISVSLDLGIPGSVESALARAEVFTDRGLRVLLCIDAFRGARALAGRELRAQALRDAVDRIYASLLPIDTLCLGEGLDVQLAALEDEQARAELSTFVTEFLRYAFDHPLRQPDIAVAFHVTFEGWLAQSPEVVEWSAQTQSVAASWFGLGDTGRALAETIADLRLESAIALAKQAGVKLRLREVSYPSATAAGSNRNQQEAFFEGILPIVAQHGATLPWVAVSAIDDPPRELCDAFRDDFRLPPAAADARCSIGLRTSTGLSTPAYDVVVEYIATINQR